MSPFSVNVSNELTSTPNTSYTYDSNGNTLTKTDSTGTTSYAWDFENRLASVTLPGSSGAVSFKYDPFGRRIYKSSSSATNVYAYDGDNLIEETSSSGTATTRYQFGPTIDEPLGVLVGATTDYYQADDLGSITSLSNSSGANAETYTYDSFGNLIASTGSVTSRYRYTGREFDSETGLYYYRARVYDARAGRFIGEDPIEFDGGINLYEYVQNRPVDMTDPMGLWPSSAWPWPWFGLFPWPHYPDNPLKSAPVNRGCQATGGASLVFDRASGTLTLCDPNGNVVAVCIAHNNVSPRSQGPWPNGTFPYAYHNPHKPDPNGPFGSHGIDVFVVPGMGPGMGVHSGRANRGGPTFPTMGCVRTTDDCTREIQNYEAAGHPMQQITIQ